MQLSEHDTRREDTPTVLPEVNEHELVGDEMVVSTGAEDETEESIRAVQPDWLLLAQQTFEASSSYIDTNLSAQWERNLANFQSRHPTGSKYHTAAYQHRARGFRPKTRSAVRRAEAACMNAFFSTADIIDISAENDADEMQRASAAVISEIMEYRLKKTIPWLQTVIGAYQDTMVSNICVTRQYWDYQQSPDGTVIKDGPALDHIPPENFRFSSGADWRNPAESSPYLIHLMPMYAGDVRVKMRATDPKTGMAEWNEAEESHIRHATDSTYNSTRQAREGKRTDSKDAERVADHETVWVHRYIVRHEGEDWEFYTLGVMHLLTQPRLLSENPHGGWRDYVVGFSVVESHKNYPAGQVELGQELQAEANDIRNQRRDNVQLAMNKRFLYKRTGGVDLQALMRSVPGGGIAVNDPNGDIKTLDTSDVTGSSYQEQDRINVDMDEVTGTFSQGSVQSNRALNETVGGMEMLTNDSNVMTEYQLRIFSATWVEPVLYQIMRLIQVYEEDNVILALAAEKADLYNQFKVEQLTEELLIKDLSLTVNVGTDSTNPAKAAERLMYGVNVQKGLGMPVNGEEVTKEIYGKMGYRDGSRFIQEVDPNAPPPVDPMVELKKQEMELNQQFKMAQLKQTQQMKMLELALQEHLTMAQVQAKLQDSEMRNQTARDTQAARSLDLQDEREIKIRMGSGI